MPAITTYIDSKPHYNILDGLRGVAAFIVVIFHLLEPHAGGSHRDLYINHGYLAVDFFFMLSGFVIAYAYDDRVRKMSLGAFFKRRLIRLQPMVVMGSIIGAALFYFQDGPCFPLIAGTEWWQVILVMLIGCTLLPLPIKYDIRGWQEIHPLNGPAWSLYFEYIGNILYALVIRHIGVRLLAVLTLGAAALTVNYLLTVPSGDIIGGWALNYEQQYVGFVRLLFPFLAGILLCRTSWLIRVKRGAFWWCSLLLAAAFSVPRVGAADMPWLNGLYEAGCILLVFPLIVSMGAGGTVTGKHSTAICNFLGQISYPLYITHFPFILIYTGWQSRTHATLAEGAPYIILAYAASIALAYVTMRFYDLPVRAWLTRRFLKKQAR